MDRVTKDWYLYTDDLLDRVFRKTHLDKNL